MDEKKFDFSSDDEFDGYVNSVALLKTLQNKEYTNDINDEPHNNTRSRRKKGRCRQKNLNNFQHKEDVTDDVEIVSVQEDLEIVSVEEEKDYKPMLKACNRKEPSAPIVLDSSDEDIGTNDNYDINVKVLWRSKTIHRLNIQNHENFSKVFQYFADLENVSIKQILITKKNKCVNLRDTPASLGLSVIDILDGGIVNADVMAQNEDHNQVIEEDICQIKVQITNKESLIVPLKKNQQLKLLTTTCARHWNIDESSIKLYFDGECINFNDTPESLDLEQEACIDLRISTK